MKVFDLEGNLIAETFSDGRNLDISKRINFALVSHYPKPLRFVEDNGSVHEWGFGDFYSLRFPPQEDDESVPDQN